MDDILASIRRILNEDEKTPKAATSGVLVLDPSMIIEESSHPENRTASPEASSPHAAESNLAAEEPLALATIDDPMQGGSARAEPSFPPAPALHDGSKPETPLVAPAAAAAAANSVGSLVRTLAAERSAAVTRGGLTIEDLVREEVRPVLKEWLDTHLPPLVERMVRAELERVVGRSV